MCIVALAAPAFAEDETTVCNPDGQQFAYGDVLDGCGISPVTDLDVFEFSASAGDDVRLLITRTAGVGAPCVEVRDPDNEVVVAQTCSVSIELNFLAPKTGSYALLTNESGNDTTIGFNMSVERLSPLRSPVPLSYGDVLSDRMINPVTDIDTFVFAGFQGSEARIVLTRTAGVGAPCAEIRGPGNAELVSRVCAVSIDLSELLPVDGDYLLVVTESGSDTQISFNLSLECVFGDCAPTPPACIVDLSRDGSTLNVDVVLATPAAARWDLYIDTLFGPFPVVRVGIPVVDPGVGFQFSIPNFPELGKIAFWSSLNTADGVTCFDSDQIDMGSVSPEATPADIDSIRRSIRVPQ